MTKIEGSGSISQRHGSADPDNDAPQNVMDPQHWKIVTKLPDFTVPALMALSFLYRCSCRYLS
jgi:hypothetical protein